jgi:hypothetical protein
VKRKDGEKEAERKQEGANDREEEIKTRETQMDRQKETACLV